MSGLHSLVVMQYNTAFLKDICFSLVLNPVQNAFRFIFAKCLLFLIIILSIPLGVGLTK